MATLRVISVSVQKYTLFESSTCNTNGHFAHGSSNKACTIPLLLHFQVFKVIPKALFEGGIDRLRSA